MSARLSISIVVPCYNEERRIEDCLNAIAAQTVKPDEVIVVDNNCTDSTVKLAEKYPFVTIIKEGRQGRGWARSAGFDAATSGIIGRIDADSVMEPNWVETALDYMQRHPQTHAMTGLGITSTLPIVHNPTGTLYTRTYYWYVHAGYGAVTMWGACCALRRSAWVSVREQVCNDDALVHEDQDISLCMIGQSLAIDQVNHLRIRTSGQTFRYIPKMVRYSALYSSTRKIHVQHGNLPPPQQLRIPWVKRIVSLSLSVVPTAVLVLLTLPLFPLDWFMLHVAKRATWFD